MSGTPRTWVPTLVAAQSPLGAYHGSPCANLCWVVTVQSGGQCPFRDRLRVYAGLPTRHRGADADPSARAPRTHPPCGRRAYSRPSPVQCPATECQLLIRLWKCPLIGTPVLVHADALDVTPPQPPDLRYQVCARMVCSRAWLQRLKIGRLEHRSCCSRRPIEGPQPLSLPCTWIPAAAGGIAAGAPRSRAARISPMHTTIRTSSPRPLHRECGARQLMGHEL